MIYTQAQEARNALAAYDAERYHRGGVRVTLSVLRPLKLPPQVLRLLKCLKGHMTRDQLQNYQANSRNRIYVELLGLVVKTFGIADVIRAGCRECKARLYRLGVLSNISSVSFVSFVINSHQLIWSDVLLG